MFRMGKEEAAAAARVIESGSLFRIGSKFHEVDQFEKELGAKIGTKHCLCLSNGTGALTAALAALEIGPGDEVIVPGYTFIATAVAVLAVGAIPVIADINETMTLDPEDVERRITPRTKAIIPVHIQGFPCHMGKLKKIANEHGLFIVEDACQSDGGSFGGQRLGSIGDLGAFSFNYFKIIAAGEGGAVVTNNKRLFERALLYHDCGAPFWNYEGEITEPLFTGTNMRVSEVTGAILRVQLTRLDDILADLRRVKKTISDRVRNVPGITLSPSNDIEGDCGVCLPMIFDTVEKAEAFEAATPGASRPINTGKHVYTNWSPVLDKHAGPTDRFNPYLDPRNAECAKGQDANCCLKTLDILSRTVYIMMNCDWTDEEIDAVVEKIKTGAKAVC